MSARSAKKRLAAQGETAVPSFRARTAAYAFLRGIDYVVEGCPLVAGNTQLRYKEAMNALESRSPGTKTPFFLGYLERAVPLFRAEDRADDLLSVELFGSRA